MAMDFYRKYRIYNKISYKCEFKMQFFDSWSKLCDASLNNGKSDTVLRLHNVYVVYLMEKERDDCNYSIEGNMTKYYVTYFEL